VDPDCDTDTVADGETDLVGVTLVGGENGMESVVDCDGEYDIVTESLTLAETDPVPVRLSLGVRELPNEFDALGDGV